MRSATPLTLASGLLVLAAGIALPAAKTEGSIANWSKPGLDGRACVSCHTVSGREVWSFSNADVMRRSLLHLNPTDARDTAASISGLRSSTAPRLRPFEPGGGSFLGESSAARDKAFGRSLANLIPSLASGEVWTLKQAERADQELRAMPLADVKTGLIFDPLSRDPVRPADGPLLGDWIPDVALSPKGTKAYAAACAEIKGALTSVDVLRIDGVLASVEGKPKTALAELSRLKRLALLVYAETSLQGRENPAPTVAPQQMADDPIWAIGNFARLYHGMTPEQLGITEETAKTVSVTLGQPLDLNPMALSWFWVGWTLDPSLQHSSLELKTKTGQYMAQALWDAGPYPWHAAYFAARRPLEERVETGEALQPEINAFVNEDVLLRFGPKDKEFILFCANVLRMHCLLMERDLKAGKTVSNPFAARQQMNALLAFVEKNTETRDASHTRAIVERCLRRLG